MPCMKHLIYDNIAQSIVADLKLSPWLSVGHRGASAKLSCEALIDQLDSHNAEHVRVSVGVLAIEVDENVA